MNASTLRPLVEAELAAARAAADRATAWHHLERAHVFSQPSPWLHTRVHAVMLAAGFADRDAREVLGQLLRLAVAGIASALGRYPVGNTGRARVPLTASMPPPAPSRSARSTPHP
jgi:hypothetical protein